MTPPNIAEASQFSYQELKRLAGIQGPCITILQPLLPAANELRQNQARLRAAIKEAERRLLDRGIDSKHARELLKPLSTLPEDLDLGGPAEGLVILRAPEVLRYFHTRNHLKESVTISNHFLVRSLLPLLESDRTFYILALSQKHIRLLRCTSHSTEEVPLPATFPRSLDENIQTDRPDHDLKNKGTGGPSTGAMKGVMFTTSTDRESKDEYVYQFYRDVDRGVNEVLRDERAPLVLAGVEYELAIYRRANSYPHLAPDAVQGAADGLKGGDLHKRALEAVRPCFDADVKKAVAMFDELSGSPRVARSVKDVVECAYEGRVLYLLVSENARYMGRFDQDTQVAEIHKDPQPGDEDLSNAAVIQTILHAGQVFVLPQNQVPDGAPVVAVLRY